MTEIDKFINNWIKESIQYYKELQKAFLKIQVKHGKIRYPDATKKSVPYIKLAATSKAHLDEVNKFLLDHFGKNYNTQRTFKAKFADKDYEKWITAIVKKDAAERKKALLAKITKITGDIIESHVTMAGNGDLNGYFVGTKGKASITTISAGGYNVQRYHYRVLVKRVK